MEGLSDPEGICRWMLLGVTTDLIVPFQVIDHHSWGTTQTFQLGFHGEFLDSESGRCLKILLSLSSFNPPNFTWIHFLDPETRFVHSVCEIE